MNGTALPSLLATCQNVLQDPGLNAAGTGASNLSRAANASAPGEPPDSSILYVVFVMLFYSTLAMTLFRCFVGSDREEKDSYQDSAGPGQPSTQTFNAGHMAQKVDFEEESSL